VYERGEGPHAEAVTSMQRALVVQARGGDLDAFSQLVRLSFPRLERVADLILRDPDRAQDAVQDALMRAWRDLRALRDPDAWDAWLRRLTVNACYDVARKDRRRRTIEVHVEPDPAAAGSADTTAEMADRDWLGRELARLDLDQRVVIVLHYYLDLPVSGVAQILDIPYGTAASRLHRGLESMRSSMHIEPETASALTTERSL
jgi:RNA polymerase sigma-70 factor (ECF subfamily)